jgi:hypothetical protein
MYGFHKVEDPTGMNPKHYEFRHPNFVPGNPELLKKIERRKAVKRGARGGDEDRRDRGQDRERGTLALMDSKDPKAAVGSSLSMDILLASFIIIIIF